MAGDARKGRRYPPTTLPVNEIAQSVLEGQLNMATELIEQQEAEIVLLQAELALLRADR